MRPLQAQLARDLLRFEARLFEQKLLDAIRVAHVRGGLSPTVCHAPRMLP